ncbi:MAG: GtrA family protein [Magnetococcales bacterium]|nr:GtrA family protein [Magnetococcales bacterium]
MSEPTPESPDQNRPESPTLPLTKRASFVQAFRYVSTAVGSTACDWMFFVLLTKLGIGYFIAQMISRISGGIYSFFTNKYWSFSSKEGQRIGIEGRRFLLLYAFSYGLSLLLITVGVEHFGLSGKLAKLAADGSCFVINFIVMRSYVYHPRRGVTDRLRTLVKNGDHS